ncbi:hypothetical protein Emed_003508 [Eimeria media]
MHFRYRDVELESALITYPPVLETVDAEDLATMLATIDQQLNSFVDSLDEGTGRKSFSVYLHPQTLDRIVVHKKKERESRYMNGYSEYYRQKESQSGSVVP